MLNAQLWWVDHNKRLTKYNLTDTLPSTISTTGKLYLVQSTDTVGQYNVYYLSRYPNLDPSTITSTDSLGQPLVLTTSDTTVASVYDALRRTEWTTGHCNILTRVKDDQQMESIDPDLYITQSEMTNLDSILCFVNGAYHQSVVDPNTKDIYIYDGGQTLRNNRTHPDVSVIDYSPIGGCRVYPITSTALVDTSTPTRSILLDISRLTGYNNETLKDYYIQLIIDGTLYTISSVTRSITSTVCSIEIGKLDLLRNYLRSPLLRKQPSPLPIDPTLKPKSDVDDHALDIFMSQNTVSDTTFTSSDWILDRITSRHSAIVLIPRSVVTVSTDLQNETNEPWYQILPTKATKLNSLLTIQGKRYSPLYLHTEGYRDRTLLPLPYHEGRTLESIDDPLGIVTTDPDRDIIQYHDTVKNVHLVQWFNIPVLGEFK